MVKAGQSPMEIGRWAYTGISGDFGRGNHQLKGQRGKPQGGAVGLELAGCLGESGAGLSRGAAGMGVKLSLFQFLYLLPFKRNR